MTSGGTFSLFEEAEDISEIHDAGVNGSSVLKIKKPALKISQAGRIFKKS